MAWTTPRTWIAGELVKEEDLNTHIRDNLNVLITSIDTATGKIKALSSSYLLDLSGTNLTGVAKLASNNVFSGGTHNFNGDAASRLVAPVGPDRWSTT